MKTTIVAIVLAMLAVPALAADKLEGFYTTYAQAQKKAKELNSPIYIHFTTTWCSWCRKMEADTYASPEGKAALKDFVGVSLDCTVEEGVAPGRETKFNIALLEKLGGSGYPFLAVLAPDGAVIMTVGGYMQTTRFVAELDQARKFFKEYNDFLAYAKTADKKGFEYNAKAMSVLAKVRKTAQAAVCAQAVLKLDPENKNGQASSAYLILLYDAQEKDDVKKMQAAFEQVIKFDPTNADGNLEKACLAEANRHFQLAKQLESKKELRNSLTILKDLAKRARKLNSPQEVYASAGLMSAYLEDLDGSIAYFEKAIAADPESPAAAQIAGMLEQLKSQRDKSRNAASKAAK